MPNQRKVKIIYKAYGEKDGVQLIVETPAKGERVAYESKVSAVIPSHCSLYLDNSKITTVELI